MKIGIIGAASMGPILAGMLTKVGHAVKISNSRGPDTLKAIAAQTGATAVSVSDAVKDVDVVFIAIQTRSVPDLPKGLFEGVPDRVIVIDITNTFPWRDGKIQAFEDGVPESRWVSDQIGRPVIKAFNTLGFPTLYSEGRPKGTPGRIAMPVAGDDARAKEIVFDLVDQLGFDGVDAGSIADSWRQQPGTPAYCTDLDVEGVKDGLARADVVNARKRRDITSEIFSGPGENLPSVSDPKELVAIIRAIYRGVHKMNPV
jgi:8-hydroxy-5-deazaflavin:NADPH oxidoreductase